MTSKEKTIRRIENLEYTIEKEKKENGHISIFSKLELEYLKQVLKDLEVLEILKETIKNNIFDVAMLDDRPNGETLLSCDDFGIKLKTEDYYKILRWKEEK